MFAIGIPPRERNFMRKLMDFDFVRLSQRVWELQSSFMHEKPGELFVTNYDFTSGLADVSVVEAVSYRSGLSMSHWDDLKDRVRRTAGQVTIDGATVEWNGESRQLVFPLYSSARILEVGKEPQPYKKAVVFH
jgi:hypothetical protein